MGQTFGFIKGASDEYLVGGEERVLQDGIGDVFTTSTIHTEPCSLDQGLYSF